MGLKGLPDGGVEGGQHRETRRLCRRLSPGLILTSRRSALTEVSVENRDVCSLRVRRKRTWAGTPDPPWLRYCECRRTVVGSSPHTASAALYSELSLLYLNQSPNRKPGLSNSGISGHYLLCKRIHSSGSKIEAVLQHLLALVHRDLYAQKCGHTGSGASGTPS